MRTDNKYGYRALRNRWRLVQRQTKDRLHALRVKIQRRVRTLTLGAYSFAGWALVLTIHDVLVEGNVAALAWCVVVFACAVSLPAILLQLALILDYCQYLFTGRLLVYSMLHEVYLGRRLSPVRHEVRRSFLSAVIKVTVYTSPLSALTNWVLVDLHQKFESHTDEVSLGSLTDPVGSGLLRSLRSHQFLRSLGLEYWRSLDRTLVFKQDDAPPYSYT